MAVFENYVRILSNFFWQYWLVWGTLALGVVYAFGLKFNFFTKAGFLMKNSYGTMFAGKGEGEGTLRGFSAAMTAIASTIGVGNVAGVATGITMGGPGALFWMWVNAWLGCGLKAGEIILGQRYRVKFEHADEYICGISYVLKNALGWGSFARGLATYSICVGPFSLMTQIDAVCGGLNQAFGIPRFYGAMMAVGTLALVILGGIHRISAVADKVVPLMGIFYMFGCLAVVFAHWERTPEIFALIYRGAFGPLPAVGGFAGSTMMAAARFGIARAVYSNEAGMGSGMLAHAAAVTDHPVRQSAWGFGECFFDTIISCSLTGLAILYTDAHILNAGMTGAPLTTVAFQYDFGKIGGAIVGVSTFLFGWCTTLASYFYSQKRWDFLYGDREGLGNVRKLWMCIFLCMVSLGYRFKTNFLWMFTDLNMTVGVTVTMIVLFKLRKVVFDLNDDFFDRYLPALEAGKNPPIVSFVGKP